MTEPPEPRRPEEGGGEDDQRWDEKPAGEQLPKYDDSDEIGPDEFFDTDWGQLERDDQMIDFLRTGDVTINDENVPEEQRAADVLGAERDRVDQTPFPESTAPDAVIAEYERRKKVAEPPGPRTPDTGGTTPMSQLSDLANAVGAQVDMQEVLAALAQAEQALSGKREVVMGLLADTAHAGAVEGAFAEASQAIANALGPVNAAGEALQSAAGAIRGGS